MEEQMREEYKLQLKQLKERMEKAEAFAARCPLFSEKILKDILTGDEDWIVIARHYKSLDLYDGVCRGHYRSNGKGTISNYKGDYDVYLWRLYINTLCEYGAYHKYGLHDICKKIQVYNYDELNCTFYCTDEQIGDLLEALNNWKIEARAQLEIDMRDEKIREAEKRIKEENEKLSILKGEVNK